MNHLERALDKQNQWWKYLLMFVVAIVASNIIGALPLLAVIFVKSAELGITPNPANIADLTVYGISPNIGLILLIFPFIVGLYAVIVLLKPMHKRTFQEVINGTNQIRWKRFFSGAYIWIGLMTVYLAVFYLANPANFTVSFNPQSFFVLILISVSLIPFQTTFEELIFRGYLSQGLAAWTRNRWVVLIIPALIFGLLHSFNPEVKEFGFWLTMPQYWLFGLLFGILTILDDGIEIAMGVHAANNVFTSIMVTHKSSVLQTPALLTQQKIDPVSDTLLLLLLGVVLFVILYRKYKWNFSVLNKKVEVL